MATEATQLPQTFFAGQQVIVTPATAQQLPNLSVSLSVSIKSKATNNAAGITFGTNGVNDKVDGTGNGGILLPGEAVEILTNNANNIYWNSANAGDILIWSGS